MTTIDDAPQSWAVTARNLPEHATNAIHTDAGARAAGFPSALVAGVTTYAYLTHPVVAAWGLEWVGGGYGEVRFRAPVYAGRLLTCRPAPEPDGDVVIEAVDPSESSNPRAVLTARRDGGPATPMRTGEELDGRRFVLDGRYGVDYGERAGDDLDLYRREGVVPPAVWPAIANNVFSTDLVNGAWIHTRSIVRHHALVPAGSTVDVGATVVDRFVRHGLRAVADLVIELDGQIVVTLEHEAIVDLSV